MSEKPQLRISVTPEPGEREKAAIAAAVVAIASNVPEDEVTRPVSKWREAGKREALRDHTWETHS